MKRLLLFLLAALTIAVLPPHAQARINWEIGRTFKAAAPPLDIAGSVDGKYIYALTPGGKLQIFSAAGEPLDTITVDASMDRLDVVGLQAANIQDKVYVSSSTTGTIQEILVDFTVQIDIKGAPFLGAADAPVVIVEFSDFECPYCSKVGALFEQILEKNPDKVKIVFKNFPLAFHKNAPAAALAALAAQQQGKFWEYHDRLFENQKHLTPEKFIEIAKELQLDIPRFEQDMNSNELKQKLAQDMQDGRQAGVRGTPTIFINGRRLKKRSVPDMQRMIDQELSREKK